MEKGIWITILGILAIVLLVTTSFAGIVTDDSGKPYISTSLRGATVELYGGEGLYRYDSTAKAVLFRGFDWANIFVCLPIALLAMVQRKRKRVRGELMMAAVFAYLAYNYLIGVMGNAFNEMFLIWTALFSIGLFGLALVLGELDIPSLPESIKARFPRRSLSVYLLVLGLFLAAQYLSEILTAYASGNPPQSLGAYTTLELAALELGIMIPLHFIGAAFLWMKRPLGYLLGVILVFTAFMTFVSLTVASLISFFVYGINGVPDVAIPAILTLVAAGFSAMVFAAVDNRSLNERQQEAH